MKTTRARRLLALVGATTIMASSTLSANAAILFQNDAEFEMDSDNLVIDFNDTARTTGDVYIKFGNSGTAGKNGSINWSMDDERFEINQNVNFQSGSTVTLESGASLDASAASQVRLREVAGDPNVGPEACSNVGEVIVDTTNQNLWICSDAGTDTWVKTSASAESISTYANDAAANAGFGTPVVGNIYYDTTLNRLKVYNGSAWLNVGPQDFEAVFATDADKTLTTGNQNFTINAGTGDLSFTSDLFDLNATDLDIDASGTVDINAAGTMALNSANWSINTDGDASLVDITATGNVNLSGAASVRIKEVADLTALDAIDCASSGELVFVVSTNTVYVCTDAGTDTFAKVGGAGTKAEVLTFNAQYPDSVLYEDGSNNQGTLETLLDNTNNRNYYNFRSTRAGQQDLDLVFKFPVPADWSAFTGNFQVDYQTLDGAGNAANAKLTATVLHGTTTCITSADNFSNDAWTTLNLSAATIQSGCASINPGDVLTVRLKLHARNGGYVTQVGQIRIPYSN